MIESNACRWQDLGGCGGPSNGRECWNHVQVGRRPSCALPQEAIADALCAFCGQPTDRHGREV